MADTKIEWADKVWNPVTGCTKVSPGCKNCYAERMALRLKAMGQPRYANGFAVTTHEDALTIPLRWRKPRRIFVNSMSDLFHQDVPDEFIDRVFAVMALCTQHTFQVLTKRPERMAAWFQRYSDLGDEDPVLGDTGIGNCLNGPRENLMRDSGVLPGGSQKWRWNAAEMDYHEPWRVAISGYFDWLGDESERPIQWPLPNVIPGATVEQDAYIWRLDKILKVPAALHFVSFEPLLGQINAAPYLDKIGWVIVGCESGPKRRHTDIDWIRSLRDQCQAAGVPFLLKQMDVGGRVVKMPMLDGRVWDEVPEVLR